MPVVLEKVTEPSQQDLVDLEKTFYEFPVSSGECLLGQQSKATIYGARFNGRLLGAMVIDEQVTPACVTYLCVREVTRNRHVASEMLRQWLLASETGCTVKPSQPTQAFEGLMKRMKFHYREGLWLSSEHLYVES